MNRVMMMLPMMFLNMIVLTTKQCCRLCERNSDPDRQQATTPLCHKIGILMAGGNDEVRNAQHVFN